MRRLIFILPVVLFVGAFVWGCPPATECQSQSDCVIGKVCNAKGACVPAAPPGPDRDAGPGADAGIGGEGEGEGEGALDAHVQTLAPVTMFQTDPADPTKALVSEVGGGLDQVRLMNLGTGAFDGSLLFNFASRPGGCGLDNVTRFDANVVGALALPPGVSSETWLACSGGTTAIYDDDNNFGNPFDVPNMPSAEIVLFLPGNGKYVNDTDGTESRALVAKRGGSTLTFVKIDGNSDSKNNPRNLEQFAGSAIPTFEHIEQLFPLVTDDNQFGDIVLVFDRGATVQKLVPIQRNLGESTWHGASAAVPLQNASADLQPLVLPAKTDAVAFRGDVTHIDSLAVAGPQLDFANLVAFRPLQVEEGSTGIVTFLRYEVELLASPPITPTTTSFESGFIELKLFASGTPVASLATDHISLFEVAGGAGDFFFYSLTQSDHAWRIPLDTSKTDDQSRNVKRAQFVNPGTDKPSQMVLLPGDVDNAWFSFSAPQAIELDFVPFVTAF